MVAFIIVHLLRCSARRSPSKSGTTPSLAFRALKVDDVILTGQGEQSVDILQRAQTYTTLAVLGKAIQFTRRSNHGHFFKRITSLMFEKYREIVITQSKVDVPISNIDDTVQ